MLGFDLADVAGQSPGVLVGPETDLETLRRVEAALRQDETVTAELVLHDADGDPVRVEATYRVRRHRARAPPGTSPATATCPTGSRPPPPCGAARRGPRPWCRAAPTWSWWPTATGSSATSARRITEVLGYDADDFVARVFAERDPPRRPAPQHRAVRRRPRRPGRTTARATSSGWRTATAAGARSACGWPIGCDDPAVHGFVRQPPRRERPPAGRGPAGRAGRPARGHRPGRAARDHARRRSPAMVERHVDGRHAP